MTIVDQGEETLNRILRRADWRFLLPVPRFARSICFANGLLAQAVQAISGETIGLSEQSTGTCDLAVARNPDEQTLLAAWKSLRPGGACYLEWTFPQIGGPAAIRRRLQHIGFSQVVCYRPFPWPDRAPTLYWLSVESPQIIHYMLTKRIRHRMAERSGLHKLLEIAWQMALMSGVLTPLSVVAYKAPVASSGILEQIRASWTKWCAEPVPQQLDCMLLTGGARRINKVVGLVFSESARKPWLVVKMARIPEASAALDRETANLRAVHAVRSGGVRGVPKILFAHQWAEQTVLAETVHTGRPFYNLLRQDNCQEMTLKVTEWLAAFAGTPTPCPRSDWWDRLVEPVIHEFEETFGPVLDPEKLRKTRDLLSSLGDLPLVCEQRDCSPWNVLVDDDGELVILDWESAEPRGLPLLDLIYFLTYTVFFLDGSMESHHYRESYRAALDPSTSTGNLVTMCQELYMRSLGLDPSVMRPLRVFTWLVHSRSEYARLVNDGAGQPDPITLQNSLFVSLWEEDLA
jgi:hypothetical protein